MQYKTGANRHQSYFSTLEDQINSIFCSYHAAYARVLRFFIAGSF
jgi:hypothetical protein